jgi:hypothetical protein
VIESYVLKEKREGTSQGEREEDWRRNSDK